MVRTSRAILNTMITPEQLVQKQLDAYNNNDLNSFCKCFASDIKVYSYPDLINTTINGEIEYREAYKKTFEAFPHQIATVTKRMVLNNTVVDYEVVTGRKPNETLEVIVIYEIENEFIKKVVFMK